MPSRSCRCSTNPPRGATRLEGSKGFPLALDDEMTAWQQQLERVRRGFECDWLDDSDRNELLEDLAKAKDAVEVAWLNHQMTL